MGAFINAVEVQRGNKITDELAGYLIQKAQEITGKLKSLQSELQR